MNSEIADSSDRKILAGLFIDKNRLKESESVRFAASSIQTSRGPTFRTVIPFGRKEWSGNSSRYRLGQWNSPRDLPEAFYKFATKSDRGTGLGLYVAKNIVEAHGGNIWAENNSNGKGATFTFTLPLSKYAVKGLENATKLE